MFKMILEYILKYHLQDCMRILAEEDNLGYFSIKIDFLKLFETYPDVGDQVLCKPVESLPQCGKDITKAQQNILEQDIYKNKLSNLQHISLKRNVQARFFGLPVCPELHRTIFPKNVDLGCFLKVTGTVVRVTQAKMLEYQRNYICMKCKYDNIVEADFENRYILKAPPRCGNIDRRCKCATFTQVHLVSREHCKDYQEIKIQEQVNKLSIGSIPGSIWVILENDLVDSCKPGDDVNICGTVRRRWRPTIQNKNSEVELVLQANYVEVCNSQRSDVVSSAPDVNECFSEFWNRFESCPLKGRDQILASVCPQVYGLHLVKLAVLLTVITGSDHVTGNDEKSFPDDLHTTRVRGQCHLLLVGDPGTGKSQLLRAGADLTARSVFTSGAGSTRAGLTCAALRENGDWQLEAGALVLSDGGVCCIDEISQLREHDRTAIHEAMEQQTISIAKAGIVCKLNTRCAVIAACNPKGHYQTDEPLSVNVSLGTPLLSRFDLIFILLDGKNKAWDKLVSSYILFGGSYSDANKKWSLDKIQMYISLVGPRDTTMTESANTILQAYYMMQRKSEYRDPSRTTVRMLDSLVRLSQVHCRLMYRTTVLPTDAIVAVTLVDLSMQDCTLDDTVDALHSTFQKHPDFEYLCTAKKLLVKLNLYEIWQEELLYYGNLLQVDHKTLESSIDRRDCNLFTKYDDVDDDNIPLSAAVVTSSYFSKQKSKHDCEETNIFVENESNGGDFNIKSRKLNEKQAPTLKKHSTLSKQEQKVRNNHKRMNINVRKRKEVTIDVEPVNCRKSKKSKKCKDGGINDNDCLLDVTEALNAVPSVNDVFTELGIDFKLHNSETGGFDGEESCSERNNGDSGKKISCMYVKSGKKEITSKSIDNNDKDSFSGEDSRPERSKKDYGKNISSVNVKSEKRECASNTIDKLQQFKFIEKYDLGKFYEEKLDKSPPKTERSGTVVKIEKLNNGTASTSQTKSRISNSQMSIFESSDCDINLDI
ncbi:unnamed protein product [Diatraea saccharalis]|uniref:DNA helicase MCM9 n=1 Tax=Diatraea saccharalis TaxID=40085 RepID=A0A9N9WAK6_9NEOP|nr:unnamed protein product [Diatraea saccharalis]